MLTSRLPPEEIKGLSPALVSRLKGGLNVPLAPPGVGARRVVLERFAGGRGMTIAPAAMQLLAERSNLTIAEGCGALLALEVGARRTTESDQQGKRLNDSVASRSVDEAEIGLAPMRRYLAALRSTSS